MIVSALLALAQVAISAPPATRVNVGGGRHIALHCTGSGGPTIILTAGLGDDFRSWASIQPKLEAKSCAWDRAGTGESDNATEPQDVTRTTGDLEKALAAAGIEPPYILVGHSIGSFETLLFAFRHRAKVAGILLVDPSSPHQGKRFAAVSPKFGTFNAARLASRSERLSKCIAAAESGHDRKSCDEDVGPGSAQQQIGRAYSAMTITENIESSSDAIDAARVSLEGTPLIVLTAGKRVAPAPDLESEMPKTSAAWTRMHDELAALSSRGEHRTIAGAGHYIHADEPDVVVEAIAELVRVSRGSR